MEERVHADGPLFAAERAGPPQVIVSGGPRSERPRVPAAMLQSAAEFLFSVNLSNPDHEEYSLKRLPRPKGRATG